MSVHTPADLVSALLGSGIATSALTYSGSLYAAGLLSGGLAAGIGIDSGVVLSTGGITNAIGTSDSGSTSPALDLPEDIDLDNIVGAGGTNDASILEFAFMPAASIVSF